MVKFYKIWKIYKFIWTLLYVDKIYNSSWKEKKLEELIVRAQDGDEEAFTELILNISDDLYKIAKTRIKNEEDISDAIQETMIETYKSIKK